MLQSAVGKRLEAEDRLDWTAFYMDELQRHERVQERGDGMSVLLNITMPKTCEVCPCNDDNWRCGATGEHFDYEDKYERRRADCPLIEVPTPHGRLIDADELANKTFYSVTSAPYITYKKFVDAPTVIEAEE